MIQAQSSNDIPFIAITQASSTFPNNKLVLTTGGRKKRMNDKWKCSGPGDKEVNQLYQELLAHVSGPLLKQMYSLDTKVFIEAINNLNEILNSETEVFMDVQDLLLKWVYHRSFELRPEITTNYIEFITNIIKKYNGAPLFNELECELLVWSAIQLYISGYRYYDTSKINMFLKYISGQVGQNVMLLNLMKLFDDNKMIADYYTDNLLEILIYVINSDDICKEFYNKKYIQIYEDLCYKEDNNNVQLKALNLVKFIYKGNPKSFGSLLKNPKSQLVEYIQSQLLEEEQQQQGPNVVNQQQPPQQ